MIFLGFGDYFIICKVFYGLDRIMLFYLLKNGSFNTNFSIFKLCRFVILILFYITEYFVGGYTVVGSYGIFVFYRKRFMLFINVELFFWSFVCLGVV